MCICCGTRWKPWKNRKMEQCATSATKDVPNNNITYRSIVVCRCVFLCKCQDSNYDDTFIIFLCSLFSQMCSRVRTFNKIFSSLSLQFIERHNEILEHHQLTANRVRNGLTIEIVLIAALPPSFGLCLPQ